MKFEIFTFYVSACDLDSSGKPFRFFLMLVPFTSHAEALNMVEDCRSRVCEIDGRGHFMAWGTCKDQRGKWGNANALFPEIFHDSPI